MNASKLGFNQNTALSYLKKVAKIISCEICSRYGQDLNEVNLGRYLIWFVLIYKKTWNNEQVFVVEGNQGIKSYYSLPIGSLIDYSAGKVLFYYNDELLVIEPIKEADALDVQSKKKWQFVTPENYHSSMYALKKLPNKE